MEKLRLLLAGFRLKRRHYYFCYYEGYKNGGLVMNGDCTFDRPKSYWKGDMIEKVRDKLLADNSATVDTIRIVSVTKL